MKLTKENIPVTFYPHGKPLTNYHKGNRVINTEYGIYKNATNEWFLTDIESGQVLKVESKMTDIKEYIKNEKEID